MLTYILKVGQPVKFMLLKENLNGSPVQRLQCPDRKLQRADLCLLLSNYLGHDQIESSKVDAVEALDRT